MGIITAARGFKDILPPETDKWRHIEEAAHKVFCAVGKPEFPFRMVR
jgi:histidyl-tRNA synthetase